MKYQFQSADGDIVERDFAPCDLPDVLRIEERAYTPLLGPTPGQGNVPAGIVKEERHVAYSLPRLWQQPNIGKIWSKFDERGHVLCEGKRDRVELSARMRATEEFKSYAWDS